MEQTVRVCRDRPMTGTPKTVILTRRAERQLKTAQRRVSRRRKGSERRRKARVLLAKARLKVRRARLDFCHKVAHGLVVRFDAIAVEKLNIKGMVKNRHLAKSISDAGSISFPS